MSTYDDLTRYEYGSDDGSLNVGWLGPESSFSTGSVPDAVLGSIAWACLHHTTNQTRGTHICEICSPDVEAECYLLVEGQRPTLLGSAEIRLADQGASYAAPTLLLHYIVGHSYLPPRQFLKAASSLPSLPLETWRVRYLTWGEAKPLFRVHR